MFYEQISNGLVISLDRLELLLSIAAFTCINKLMINRLSIMFNLIVKLIDTHIAVVTWDLSRPFLYSDV